MLILDKIVFVITLSMMRELQANIDMRLHIRSIPYPQYLKEHEFPVISPY